MHQNAWSFAHTITLGSHLFPGTAARAVHDPEDQHLIVVDDVVDDIRVTQERHAPYARPLCHFLGAFGKLADPLGDAPDASFKLAAASGFSA